MDVRGLVGIKIKERGVKDLHNPLLDRVFNKLWQQTVPELAQEAKSNSK
ncbi:hypothetical protein ACFLU8_02995 [Chloroflexota bacterium]